jgi:type 1 glutamine amidotransferase
MVVLHWGMGTVEAKNIAAFVKLFGGCHGGPDRKHDTVDVTARIPDPRHPICRGIADFEVRDEFYYRLKFVQPISSIIPLVQADIEGKRETVAWAWERGDGGRSFGFSGLHFHQNWRLEPYRRLAVQAVLWTMRLPAPESGVDLDVPEALLSLK